MPRPGVRAADEADHAHARRDAGIDAGDGILHDDPVGRVDPELLRPVDTPLMVGDAGKALRELGWKPSVGFAELVAKMVDHDIELLQEG